MLRNVEGAAIPAVSVVVMALFRLGVVLLLEICQAILQHVDRAFEYELVEGRHWRCGA